MVLISELILSNNNNKISGKRDTFEMTTNLVPSIVVFVSRPEENI